MSKYRKITSLMGGGVAVKRRGLEQDANMKDNTETDVLDEFYK